MCDVLITGDAEKLLGILCKGYRKARKRGLDHSQAKAFGSAATIRERFKLKWSEDEVASMCCELNDLGFLNVFEYAWEVDLTRQGIAYIESKSSKRILARLWVQGLQKLLEAVAGKFP